MYCATTAEMDDELIAVSEITEQLKSQGEFLKNSVGLIAMDAAYYGTDVYSAIVNALPFPSIAYSTSFSGSNGEAAEGILSVVVLTSDDNSFEIFRADNINTYSDMEGTKSRVEAVAAEVYKKGTLSLIMPYWSGRPYISSDDVLAYFDQAYHQTPMFGSVVFTFLDGELNGFTCIGDSGKCENSAVFIAVYGALEPRFMVATGINEAAIMHAPVKVTKAVSNTLYEVNNITLLDYLKKIGFVGSELNAGTRMVFPSRIENPETAR
jgi:hypothetical protein